MGGDEVSNDSVGSAGGSESTCMGSWRVEKVFMEQMCGNLAHAHVLAPALLFYMVVITISAWFGIMGYKAGAIIS